MWTDWDAGIYCNAQPRPFADCEPIEVRLAHGGRNVLMGSDIVLTANNYTDVFDVVAFRKVDPDSEMAPSEMRSIRKSLGLTQAELGKAIGLGVDTISRMEKGKAPIEKRTIMAIRYLRLKRSA